MEFCTENGRKKAYEKKIERRNKTTGEEKKRKLKLDRFEGDRRGKRT